MEQIGVYPAYPFPEWSLVMGGMIQERQDDTNCINEEDIALYFEVHTSHCLSYTEHDCRTLQCPKAFVLGHQLYLASWTI